MKLLHNRWLRRITTIVALLCVVGAAVVAVLWFKVRKDGEARLTRAVAELDATDPGWRTVDLEAAHNAAVAPPDQNAGEQVLAALSLLTDEYKEFDKESTFRRALELPHLPHPDALSALRAALTSSATAVEKVGGIRRFPGGGFRLTYKEPELVGTSLDKTQEVRSAAGLLDYSAMLLAADDQADESLDRALCLLHLERAVGDESFEISQIVRMAALQVGPRSIECTLAWTSSPSEQKLADVQAELLRLSALSRLKVIFRAARATTYRLTENLESGALDPNAAPAGSLPPDTSWRVSLQRRHWPGQKADALGYFNRMVAVADLPSEQRLDAAIQIQREFDQWMHATAQTPMSRLFRLMPPTSFILTDADTRTIGVLRATATAVAFERFRLKHGRFPTALAELTPDFLTAIPADPYTGRPLLYKKTDDGAVVYSTGRDRTDDGGTKLSAGGEQGTDIGFRLFDPKHRRQPPLPKED